MDNSKTVEIAGRTYSVKSEGAPLSLHGKRGAHYLLVPNARCEVAFFVVNARSYTQPFEGVWFTNVSGELEILDGWRQTPAGEWSVETASGSFLWNAENGARLDVARMEARNRAADRWEAYKARVAAGGPALPAPLCPGIRPTLTVEAAPVSVDAHTAMLSMLGV